MKRKLISLILILLTILQTGCWDMEEINELGFVTVVGIDFSLETNKYLVTAQIANPAPKNSNSTDSGFSDSVWVCSAEGPTIFEALRNLARISSKRITWSHNIMVILGEAFAKNDITPAIDFFTHNPQLRMKTAVVVSNGNAKNYVASKVGLSTNNGISFGEMTRLSSLPAVSIPSSMLKVNSDFSGDYSQVIISRIDFKNDLLSSDANNNVAPGNAVAIEGCAIFKKNKMVGWLSPEETRGLAWLLNNAQGTVVTVDNSVTTEYSDTSINKVSIEVKKIKCTKTSKIIDGIPNITIDLTGEGNIVEEDGISNLTISEFKKRIEDLLNKEIYAELEKGIGKVQKYYESDVLGFAQIVRVQNNQIWKGSLKDEWQKTFPLIPIRISVNINIITSTLNQEPTRPTKGK